MTDDSRKKHGTDVSTGYRVLDRFIGGFSGGQLVVIASRPSEGKRALAASLAENMAHGESQVPIGFIPLETGESALKERMISCKAIIRDSLALNLHELCREIREMAEVGGVKAVFIDGVGLIGNAEHSMSKSMWVAEVFKALKLQARELGISIICLCPLDRIDSAFRGQVVRDTGYSDIVLLIDNPAMRLGIKEDDTGISDIRKVIVARNNNGSTGGFLMRLNPESGRFEEVGA